MKSKERGKGFKRMVCSVLSKAAAVMLALSTATAANANIVEIQIEGSRFSAMVEQAVKTFPFCPQEIPGMGMILDKIEINEPVYLRRNPYEDIRNVSPSFAVSTHPAQLVLPLTLGLKTEDQTRDPDYNGEYGMTFVLDAILHLAFDGNALHLNLASTEPDIGIEFVELIQDYFGGIRLPIAFDTFNTLLPGAERIIGSGVTVTADNWLALRTEYSGRDCSADLTANTGWSSEEARLRELQQEQARCRAVDETAWLDFHEGIVGPRREGDEWTLFVDQLLLRQSIEEEIRPLVGSHPDIALAEHRFSSGWTPLGDDGAEIPFFISGTYTASYCNITFVAEPSISMHLAHGELVVAGELGSIWLSSRDEIKCALSLTTLFSGAFFPGLNHTAAMVLFTVLHNTDLDMDLSGVELGSGWDCSGGEGTLNCSIPVELPPLRAAGMPESLGALTLEYLSGEPDGFLIGGLLDVAASEPYENNATLEPFEFGIGECCRDRWFAATLLLDGYGNICSGPRIIDDPLDAFGLEPVRGGWRVRLDTAVWDAFWADPYPARVHIRTDGGTATYEFDPGMHPDDAQMDGWNASCGAARALCELRGGFQEEPEFSPGRDPEIRYVKDLGQTITNPEAEVELDDIYKSVNPDTAVDMNIGNVNPNTSSTTEAEAEESESQTATSKNPAVTSETQESATTDSEIMNTAAETTADSIR